MIGRALPGLLLLVAALPAQAAAHDTPPPAAAQAAGYQPSPCVGDFSRLPNRVECGLLTVPETRGAANGRKVVLPVVIVRGMGERPKPDPVIFLHGGPGGSAVEHLPSWLPDEPQLFTGGRDLIFLDQRGTGLAVPSLDCGSVGLSDAGLTDDSQVEALRACGLRLQAAGVDLGQYNSAVIAADLADLRRLLGVGDYNLLGGSYGTTVAMAVMHRDTRGLRAVVLDSLWPPEANWTAPLPRLVSRETRRVLARCAADAGCTARHPQLERRFDALMTAWLEQPRSDAERTYTADEAAAFLLETLYDDRGARELPSRLEQWLRGDFSGLADFLREQSGYTEGQFMASLCKEEFPFESAAAVDAGESDDPIAVAAARTVRRFFAACDAFPVGEPDPVDNQPVVSDIPTLILAAEIDAGCPVELAEAAVQRLSRGQLAVFSNLTHGVRGQSACAQSIVRRFLDAPGEPVDASCVDEEQRSFEFSEVD